MFSTTRSRLKSASDVLFWQSLRSGGGLRPLAIVLIAFTWMAMPLGNSQAQIHDSLDSYPPRWYLDRSDCNARLTKHGHLSDGGVGGGACERVTFKASHGTEALLVYPIEPVRPLDDLNATVSVMSAKEGARIGFRVRYPYLRDPATSKPVSVVVYGASYRTPGRFATIGIGAIERPLRLKAMAVRREHGATADLQDAYVDGVVINAYSGPGKTALRIDELQIDGLIPVGEMIAMGNRSMPAERSPSRVKNQRAAEGASVLVTPPASQRSTSHNVFPLGKVTRILQHNGEPLFWVRSLGFDAILLSHPPDADILREAIRSRLKVYAPPPSAPDPSIESLLEPVVAWHLGSGQAMDRTEIDQFAAQSKRLRQWPSRWRRPLVGAPSESWQRYAVMLDAIIDDLPPRVRGIRGNEEVAQMQQKQLRLGSRVENAVGIVSMPPQSLLRQSEAIADAIGAPRPAGFRWHSMWLQAMRSLEASPSAILFRSTESLSSGSPLSTQRAMALSYVNRMIASIAPWIASGTPSTPPPIRGAAYRCTKLTSGTTDLLLLTSTATRGSEVLAGDGEVITIQLDPTEAARTAWRATHFSAERLLVETNERGAQLSVVSPDVVELILLSSDPAEGGRLATSAERFAKQASLDRWQLATELVERTRSNWELATAMRSIGDATSSNLVEAAQATLRQAEPHYRSGDVGSTLRMARRADAWGLRSEWQLAERLMPHWPHPTSCPPVEVGALATQSSWRGLMDEAGWGKNRLTTGSLDSPDMLNDRRWSFGKRLTDLAGSDVLHIQRGDFAGGGALRAHVVPLADDPLPGGYEGTVVQIRSPGIRVAAGEAVRIDAMVRTIGFGSPHQGLLVYESIGGQEAGVLVRGAAEWTPVRLYRQCLVETDLHVMFEVIGEGEATIDEVELRVWEPENVKRPLIRSLQQSLRQSARNDQDSAADTSTRR